MGKAFDVGLERLVGGGVSTSSGEWLVALRSSGQTSDESEQRARNLNSGESGAQNPQGLKPQDDVDVMSDLKVRPAKENAQSGTAAGLGDPSSRELRRASSPCATVGQTFYLETFGCQMNEHDSEKVAGVLLARGYKQVERADQASVVLYNTCSIREKAAQKVFSRLGEWRPGERSQSSVVSSQFRRRETQAPPSRDEGGAPGDEKRSGEWRVTSGESEEKTDSRTPQGLEPRDEIVLMSDLKVRTPKEREETAGPADSLCTTRRQPIIGVLGCVAQQEGEEIFKRAPWVSLVCGSASYRKLPQMIEELERGNRRVTGLDTDTDETFETDITRRDNPWRAYLTIIEGCDKACSYCVVPFTRGPERSRTSASILAEVRQLAEAGYTEVQLLGQTVNSYADPSARKMRFSELLVAVAEVRGIRRVRFTTSHPRDFGKDIVEAIEAIPGICEHVHLPVQSGSTNVLKAMVRTYTRDEYLEKVALMKSAKREISITTDIIVGFPGETERDFEETLSLMETVKYDGAFCFKYSPRPNTPSLKMDDAIPEEEKSRRLGILLEKQREIQRAKNEKLVGETLEVLVEGKSRRESQWSGHTSSNKVMNFTSQRQETLGDYVRVKVLEALPNSLIGICHGDTEGTEE